MYVHFILPKIPFIFILFYSYSLSLEYKQVFKKRIIKNNNKNGKIKTNQNKIKKKKSGQKKG